MLKPKVVLSATIGNAIEYYDMTLYGFFAVYLSPLFFPADNLLTSQLASFGAFAAGFVARPFGGMIFGYIGDHYGRKKALVSAILLVTIPTTIIGILPSYHSIGLLAPFTLVLCRILQGICTGGEYSGAAIFLSEHHQQGREGFAGSILPASSIVGGIFGTTLGGLCTLSMMPNWAWRIPFLIGGVFGIVGYFLRNTLVESPEFLSHKDENQRSRQPLLKVFKQERRAFFCTFGIAAYNIVLFYVPVIVIVQLMLPKDILASSRMFLNTGLMFLLIILLPVMGVVADRFGKRQVMLASVFMTFIISLPLFIFLHIYNSFSSGALVLAIFALLISASVAPSVTLLPALFPIHRRYRAMALSVGLGDALGGATPVICQALVSWMESSLAPAFYLMLFCILGGTAIHFTRPTKLTLANAAPKNSLRVQRNQKRVMRSVR